MPAEQLHAETGGPCEAFSFDDAVEAHKHIKSIPLIDYGDRQYGHFLHTWDDGGRRLVKCANCGGLILIQSSEFHSFSDSPDSYYVDYFPVSSSEEADEINRRYSGSEIEYGFPKRYLMRTNGRVCWSK